MSIETDLAENFRRLEAEIAKLKQERDELAAMVGVMREALLTFDSNLRNDELISYAINITGPDALREIQAMTLEEAADNAPCDAIEKYCRTLAAALRKGE